MSRAPYMPLFVDDLIGSTSDLSAEEFGALLRILCRTWSNGAEPLPDDPRKMARVVGCDQDQWSEIRPALLPYFDLSAGTWRSVRLDREWMAVDRKRAQQKAASAAGVEARKGKAPYASDRTVDQPVNRTVNQPYPYPYPYPYPDPDPDPDPDPERHTQGSGSSSRAPAIPELPAPTRATATVCVSDEELESLLQEPLVAKGKGQPEDEGLVQPADVRRAVDKHGVQWTRDTLQAIEQKRAARKLDNPPDAVFPKLIETGKGWKPWASKPSRALVAKAPPEGVATDLDEIGRRMAARSSGGR